MSTELMGFFIGLLVLLVFMFVYSLFDVEKVDLLSRIQQGSIQAAVDGRRGIRTSNSLLGQIYGKYAGATMIDRVEQFAVYIGLNMEHLQSQIDLSDMTDKISAVEVVAFKILGLMFLPIAVAPVLYSGDMVLMIIAFLIFTALFFLPEGKIRNAIKVREESIIAELPTFIEQIYLCIEAGSNLKPALETVSDRIGGELGKAFHESFVMETYSGSWERELLGMCERMHIEVLEDFVTDILNASEKGISIVDTLQNEVKHINMINRSRIREMTERVNSSMVVPIIVFFVLPVVAIIMVPILLQVMEVLM